MTTTAANVGEVSQVGALLYGKGTVGFGDAGYIGAQKRTPAKRGRDWHSAAKRSAVKPIEDETVRSLSEQIEHLKASIRAAVEHPFRAIKRQFGEMKTRFLRLLKNGARMLTLFVLSTLWITGKHLLENSA